MIYKRKKDFRGQDPLDSKYLTGQATLEMTLAIIVVLIVLAGTARIFMWFTTCLVGRTNEDIIDVVDSPPILRVLPEEDGRDDLPRHFYDHRE